MVPKAIKILFSRTFPGQNCYIPGQSIHDLKVINQNMCEKAYHIYSMHDQSLTNFMVHAASSSSFLAV